MKKCCQPCRCRTHNLLITSRTCIQMSQCGRLYNEMKPIKNYSIWRTGKGRLLICLQLSCNMIHLLSDMCPANIQIIMHSCAVWSDHYLKKSCILGYSKTALCLFDLGLTSLSTIFQSYCDGAWMWQGAQCSLLECCLTEISRPRHFDMIFHPVTLYWHWADQFRFLALLS